MRFKIFCRLGFVIDFLSKATLVGFMAGAAVIVSLQQLKGLLGIVHFTSKMEIVPVLSSVFSHKNEVKKNGMQLFTSLACLPDGFQTLLLKGSKTVNRTSFKKACCQIDSGKRN